MRRRYAETVTAATMLLLMITVPGIVRANGGKGMERWAATRAAVLDKKSAESNEVAQLQAGGKDAGLAEAFKQNRVYVRADAPSALQRLFPGARYYKWFAGREDYVQLAILAKGKLYTLSRFNRLLLDYGMEVNEQNEISIARAFAALALGETYGRAQIPFFAYLDPDQVTPFGFPEVTFLEGKGILERDPRLGMLWHYQVNCRIGNDPAVQTWKFSVSDGQFAGYQQFIGEKGVSEGFLDVFERKGTGGVDLGPSIEIATDSGNATVEQDSFYYLVIESDGSRTNYWIRFRLSGLNPGETVYVKVTPVLPYVYGPSDTLGPIIVGPDSQARYDWQPGPEIRTGMSWVSAGNMPPGDTFKPRTAKPRNLTLEAIKRGGYTPTESFEIHYCEQFFMPDPGRASAFADNVATAAQAAWSGLVTTAGFPAPVDTLDHVHQFLVGDGVHWFHDNPVAAGVADSSYARKIRLSSLLMTSIYGYMNSQHWPYDGDTSALIASTVLHEFYHLGNPGTLPRKSPLFSSKTTHR